MLIFTQGHKVTTRLQYSHCIYRHTKYISGVYRRLCHRTRNHNNAFPSIQPFSLLSLILSQLRSAHSLHQRNYTNKHANLPARTETRRSSTGSTRRRLLILAERRLQRQIAGRIARLAEVGIGVDLVGDASRPVGDVFGLRLAPVVAAGVVGLHGALAAAGAHFLDEVGVGDGDGAHQVGLGLVGIAETGDEGGGTDRVGRAADCGGRVLVGYCCGGRVVGDWAGRTLAVPGLLGHDGDVSEGCSWSYVWQALRHELIISGKDCVVLA